MHELLHVKTLSTVLKSHYYETHEKKINYNGELVSKRNRKKKANGRKRNGAKLPRFSGRSSRLVTGVSFNVSHDQPKEEICPVCAGEGGVNGGCYKCGGSGWVSSQAKSEYAGRLAQKHLNENTRISNASYRGENVGAHYRDRDGRIGSIPLHDDYSEDGDP